METTTEQSCLVVKAPSAEELATKISACNDRWKLFRVFSPADHSHVMEGQWTAFMVSKTRLLSGGT